MPKVDGTDAGRTVTRAAAAGEYAAEQLNQGSGLKRTTLFSRLGSYLSHLWSYAGRHRMAGRQLAMPWESMSSIFSSEVAFDFFCLESRRPYGSYGLHRVTAGPIHLWKAQLLLRSTASDGTSLGGNYFAQLTS